ncbi:MAG: SCO family protein [Haliscomenobacter sp.]|nr:SCO family protein [Haliscomenobacter sp.]MBP9872572.1 SCO family protein [Haliscomenobacter sp.]
MLKYSLLLLGAALLLVGCNLKRTPEALPILGNSEIVNGDTIYHQVRDFSFINQDSQEVNNATFEGKAYVVDFFFISCPTICPMVNKQMLRVYDRFKDDDRLLLLAHSIDTKHDTIPRLKQFAQNLGVSNDKWIFVTGIKDSIYSIANDYFSIAIEDPEAPGGFDHSGRLILVDKNRHVRSFCDGTDPESVDRFMKDIEVLLKEM